MLGLAARDKYTGATWADFVLPFGFGQPSLDYESGVDKDDLELLALPGVVDSEKHLGTVASKIMAFKKWNRIYVTSGKGKTDGVVMLLVAQTRPERKDGVWTAVDPRLRVQVVNTKDKDRVFTRPRAGVTWGDHPGLSEAERASAEQHSERMIDRMAHANWKDPPKASPKDKKKKKNNKTVVAWWFADLSWTGGTAIWARRNWGASVGASFLAWRAWVYFGVADWVAYGYSWMETAVEAGDATKEFYEEFLEMKASGDLDLIFLLVGPVLVAGIWFWRRKASEKPSDSDSDSDAANDDENFQGTAVSDTDDEPSPKEMFTSMMAQQDKLMQDIAALQKGGKATPAAAPLTPRGGGDQDEATEAQVDRFLAQLKEHAKVVEMDEQGPHKEVTMDILKPTGGVKQTIEDLERKALNPREALLKALKNYRDVPAYDSSDLKARVAPHILARLYRGGRTAKQEMTEWRRSKQLERCQSAGETIILAMVLDRMLEAGEDLVNNGSSELITRRLYALLKAYERVNRLEDWQRPKNQAGGKWKSKVDWMLSDMYFQVDADQHEVPEADDEVQEKLKRKALFQTHLAGASEAAPAAEE